MDLDQFEDRCRDFVRAEYRAFSDSSHDINHVERVVQNAKNILQEENADQAVVIVAAWLHDCVIIPKDDPKRAQASVLAAEKAENFLKKTDFQQEKIKRVKHAVAAHSYSAGIAPRTKEAKIVQDADHLDAIGAIGIARCMMVGGKLDRLLYHPEDPFIEHREADDSTWTLDHFYEKLFKLPDIMHTETARLEAKKRVSFMKGFLSQLRSEINL